MTYPEHTPRWRRYLRFFRADVRADIEDELRFHFDSRIEELLARGYTADAARAAAEAEFGDVRDVQRGLVSIDRRVAARRSRLDAVRDFIGDVRYALRSLRRTPGVALAILATLGLGVGANAAMFTLLDAIFVRPPAGVAAPSGVRRVWRTIGSSTGTQYWPGYSYVEFSAIVDAIGNRAVATIYSVPGEKKLGFGESTDSAKVSYANRSYFSLLGVHPELGRFYSSDEDRLDGPDHVALLSHDYWMRAFGGKRSAIGSTIVVAAQKYTVVGVAEQGFTGVDLDAADIWLPLGLAAEGRTPGGAWWRDTRLNGFQVILRPRAGVDDKELEQRITTALRRTDEAPGVRDTTTIARLGSILRADGPGQSSQEQRIAVRLAGVAIIVLLIACANVVNLLLSRAVRRRREIAVRLALGISRARLVRLLLVESGVLAASSAVVAVAMAYAGGNLLRQLLLPDVHWARSPLDWSVVLLALGVAVVAGLLAGLVPALQAANPELTDALKAGGGSGVIQGSHLRGGLVVIQAALSVVLLVGAVLFVRSLSNIRNVDIGYDTQHLMTASVSYDGRSTSSDSTFTQRIAQLADRIKGVPGVENVALTSMQPMSGFSFMTIFTDTDPLVRAPSGFPPTVTGVSPSYFATAGLAIVRGRGFSAAGSTAPAEVIVNGTMARERWPGRNALGQCMRFEKRDAPCYTVVGVVEDSRRDAVIEKPAAMYYLPLGNVPLEEAGTLKGWDVLVRGDPARAAQINAATRSLIRQDFPGGIPHITWLRDQLEPEYRPWELGAELFTAFGVLALIVAVVGIYSTVSYGVNQRIHEFGVRIALGAQLSNVLRLVVGNGLRTVAIGVGCGVVLALLAGRFVTSLLYGVTPADPLSIGVVVAILLIVGAAAALIPAWRAARVDPVSALRAD